MKEKKSFRSKIKTLAVNSGLKSSVHCLPSFSDSKTFTLVKLVWTLITVLSWAYWIYQTYGLYQSYQAFKVITSYSLIIDKKLEFPAVTICNLNPFYNVKSFISEKLDQRGFNISKSTSLLKYTDTANNIMKSVFEYIDENNEWSKDDPPYDMYYLGFYHSEIIITCEFNGVTCSYENFYAFHDYNYGNCFRFNGNDQNRTGSVFPDFVNYPTKSSKKIGWENGLRLELYTGDQESLQQFVYKTGMRVIVHNQSVIAFPDEDGVDIPVGKQTNIALSRTLIDRLPQPYSNCIDQLNEDVAQQNDVLKEMFNQKQSNKIKLYQQNYCLKICQQNYFIRTCGCFSYALKSLNVSTITTNGCYSQDEIDCVEKADVDFSNSDEIDKCYSKCPQACQEYKIDYKTSQAAYPTFSYVDGLNNSNLTINYNNLFLQFNDDYFGPTYDIVKSTGLMLNIYYDSNSYINIKESPALAFDSLISNIGGNMGLFTGASILTLVELIEYAISIIITLFIMKFTTEITRLY